MAVVRSQAEHDLADFVGRELVDEPLPTPLGADDDLLSSGLIDSLGVMRLIRFIEERFGVSIPPADITIEHFMTLGTIVTYLESLGSRDGSSAEG
ncbi:MAG: acyl carrier protein [Acidobacteriota bacterium]